MDNRNLGMLGYDTIAFKGQDFSCSFSNDKLSIQGVIVADGLGSCKYAKETAEIVANAIKDALEAATSEADLNLGLTFRYAKKQLIVHARDQLNLSESDWDPRNFGTTLILAIEHEDHFTIAYVGNGAVWHLRGNLFSEIGNRLLPWNCVNLLNPHTVPENGREALYKYFTIKEDDRLVQPSVISLSKDAFYGDILMICTDGISSNDQMSIGKVASGIWSHVERPMVEFYEALKNYLVVPNEGKVDVSIFLKDYLETLMSKKLLDDDASIGMILTSGTESYGNHYR